VERFLPGVFERRAYEPASGVEGDVMIVQFAWRRTSIMNPQLETP
jgi:hypothetical protein